MYCFQFLWNKKLNSFSSISLKLFLHYSIKFRHLIEQGNPLHFYLTWFYVQLFFCFSTSNGIYWLLVMIFVNVKVLIFLFSTCGHRMKIRIYSALFLNWYTYLHFNIPYWFLGMQWYLTLVCFDFKIKYVKWMIFHLIVLVVIDWKYVQPCFYIRYIYILIFLLLIFGNAMIHVYWGYLIGQIRLSNIVFPI